MQIQPPVINIFEKEVYYSELTFQYWYWKNKLDINDKSWIGFCQKRRFWLKKEKKIKAENYYTKDDFLITSLISTSG